MCLTSFIIVPLEVLIKYIFSINNIPKRNTLYIEKRNENTLMHYDTKVFINSNIHFDIKGLLLLS